MDTLQSLCEKKKHIPPIFSASFASQLNTARDPHGDRTSPWAHFPSFPFSMALCLVVCLFFFLLLGRMWQRLL